MLRYASRLVIPSPSGLDEAHCGSRVAVAHARGKVRRAMCTIITFHRAHAAHDLIVGATRDEFVTRPSSPPRPIADNPRVVAGVDEERGGTWMGVAEPGLFVGLTNQRAWTRTDTAPRSRGLVALDALKTGSVEGVRGLLARLDPRSYNGFNLMFGDGRRLFVAYARRDREEVEIHELEPGLHVLTNDRMGSVDFPKAERAASLARAAAAHPWPELGDALQAMLADHATPPDASVPDPPEGAPAPARETLRALQQICVHADGYGTRSATVLALNAGRIASYRFASGPPCTHPFEDLTHLFDPHAVSASPR